MTGRVAAPGKALGEMLNLLSRLGNQPEPPRLPIRTPRGRIEQEVRVRGRM